MSEQFTIESRVFTIKKLDTTYFIETIIDNKVFYTGYSFNNKLKINDINNVVALIKYVTPTLEYSENFIILKFKETFVNKEFTIKLQKDKLDTNKYNKKLYNYNHILTIICIISVLFAILFIIKIYYGKIEYEITGYENEYNIKKFDISSENYYLLNKIFMILLECILTYCINFIIKLILSKI